MLTSIRNVKLIKMRLFTMFVTAVCVLFLIKLRWPKNKSLYVMFFLSSKNSGGGGGLQPHPAPSPTTGYVPAEGDYCTLGTQRCQDYSGAHFISTISFQSVFSVIS